MLTPSDVRRLLAAHGLAPRRYHGQNFLVDPNWVDKIVRDARVAPTDTIIEVGAGLGSLTLGLADAAARVVAVEIDSGLVRALREVVGDRDTVEIVHADALACDLGGLAGGSARLVSNLPYSVATPVVLHALDDPCITDLFVMVQREVGERWCAAAGDQRYGGVSARLALQASCEIVAAVPRTVFYPPPNVDSVTVRIVRDPDAPGPAERERVSRVIDAGFATRRKTLRNALRRIAPVEAVEQALDTAGVERTARAEQLDVDDFRRLAGCLDAASR